jgi:putative hydrolase of the HAD superfamily
MQFKNILIDADGVVLKREKYFSEIYAESVGLDAKADFLPFFQGDFQRCITGEADLIEVIKPWLRGWKWEKTPEAFLEYWFKTESNLQQEVLDFIAELRKKGVKAYLASQQERRRGEFILNQLGFKHKFDGFFLSYDMGVRKDDPQFFKKILRILKTEAGEILFVDDEQENLDAAGAVGIQTHLFQNLPALRHKLS